MRRTKEDAALTREQLLQAALVTFSANGYSRTTLEDIAQQAGTTRGAIHWHFGNKAELFNTLVRESYQRPAQMFYEVMTSQGTPLQILRRLMIRWLCYIEEDSQFRTIMELLMLKTEIMPELATGMQEKAQGNHQVLKQFVSILQQAIAASEVRPDVNTDAAAVGALSLINGTAMHWLIDPTSFPLSAYAEIIVDLYIRGIATT